MAWVLGRRIAVPVTFVDAATVTHYFVALDHQPEGDGSMKNRTLNVRREVLTELTSDELVHVVGGDTDTCPSQSCPITFTLLCLYYTQNC